jgi:2-keto-4-pentenoate hydratase/2-oxohepta-3-ene-1,7-dioic acid hydratase in catechol pathway
MKIASVVTPLGRRAALVVDGHAYDVATLLDWPGPDSGEILEDFTSLIVGPRPALARLQEHWTELEQDLVTDGHEQAALGAWTELTLGPPVRSPTKILCAGLNYLDHVREIGASVPTNPLVFSKLPSSLSGPFAPIRYPVGVSDAVDYEVELAVVIGRPVRSVDTNEARSAVAGYMVVNDVSARDWQFDSEGQLTLGKGFDSFFPTGPWVTTADEVVDPAALRIRAWVDDELVQDSSTAYLIKGVDELVSWLSNVCTLLPGDVIATGTPPGVGLGKTPPRYLELGERVTCEIEGLGRISNEVCLPLHATGDGHGW